MITDKVLPAFYILDLDGKAADLEFILGKKFKIKRMCLGSHDFDSDISAIQAAEKAINFFKEGSSLVTTSTNKQYNPEFFPSTPAIVPTEDMLFLEELSNDEAEKLEEESEGTKIALVMTRRFDPIGDFVVAKSNHEGDDFSIRMKVAITPTLYMNEKNLEKQEQLSLLYGATNKIQRTTNYH